MDFGFTKEEEKLRDEVRAFINQGVTPEFWGNCDAICNQEHWDLWGVINCGKGQPGQTAEMSHGGAPTRFRNVMCGIKG